MTSVFGGSFVSGYVFLVFLCWFSSDPNASESNAEGN